MFKGMIRRAAVALLALIGGAALAGETVAVRVELLSAPTIQLQARETVESPIQVRVLRQSDSRPLEGVIVVFLVNEEFCPPLLTCPDLNPRVYGRFLPAPGEAPGIALGLSDTEGVAVSPDFQAGSAAGSYEIVAYVTTAVGQDFSSFGTPWPAVQVQQGGGVGLPALVPATSWHAQALLVALMLLLGGLVQRRLQG